MMLLDLQQIINPILQIIPLLPMPAQTKPSPYH
jgi:hypothetical protein